METMVVDQMILALEVAEEVLEGIHHHIHHHRMVEMV
tara:strand:- start:93 stop:203 length:111 start_codon:yes stop_codon:yes gene_type:complete